MFKNLKVFMCGFLVAIMLFSVIAAAPVQKSISVMLNTISIQINGKAVSSEVIVYNNNLYAPVKNIVAGLGKSFTWDVKTNKVVIADIVPKQPANGRTNPAGLNQKMIVNGNDFINGDYALEMTMTDVISGDLAWEMIKGANMFNVAAPEGKEYILAKFKVKLLNIPNGRTFTINRYSFDLVSEKGVLYKDAGTIAGLDPDLRTELYKDAEHEGWTYFLVDKTDNPVVAFNRGYKGETWFKLRAK